MSDPTDRLLAERRLRSVELALEAARARAADRDDVIAGLRGRVAELETELEQEHERRRTEPERLDAALRVAAERQLAAEQALLDERAWRRELEGRLELVRAGRHQAGPPGEEELTALRQRAHEAEAELEVVRHGAAELEQAVRVAIADANRRVAEMEARLTVALRELEGLRREATEESRRTHETVNPESFDAALWRLRDSSGSEQAEARRLARIQPGRHAELLGDLRQVRGAEAAGDPRGTAEGEAGEALGWPRREPPSAPPAGDPAGPPAGARLRRLLGR